LANEITAGASLVVTKNSQTYEFSIGNRSFTMSGNIVLDYVISIATTETALGTFSGGWILMYNMDGTNYVEVKTATSGTIFAKLKAGEFALFRAGSGVTAPYAIANTGACKLRVMILED